MQYTEEHYAQLYSELPEGLKDLVLSGRLAILVSAIGSRHGLNADQVSDLEPAIEDVCLGLITTEELVANILKTVNIDQRVANRIAAEAELEILKPFSAELIIARKQKEDLDASINKDTHKKALEAAHAERGGEGPKDVSDHSQTKKVSDWYAQKDSGNKNEENKSEPVNTGNKSFDWDKDFGKKTSPTKEAVPEVIAEEKVADTGSPTLEKKLDVLTESINKLVNTRFGSSDKKEPELSSQMQELIKRLEKAEKENEENKKIIRSLQVNKEAPPMDKIFGENKIQIDKERKVDINHKENKTDSSNLNDNKTGNIQITSVSKPITIEKIESVEVKKNDTITTSTVSKDTVDSIVELRNKVTPNVDGNDIATQNSTKKTLSLDELLKGDTKIKEATMKTATMTFPGLNEEVKVEIKNVNQKENLRQTLLDDLEFLKSGSINNNSSDTIVKNITPIERDLPEKQSPDRPSPQTTDTTTQNIATGATSQTYSTNPFKDELLPKTKEERMKVLQDKIKALNKGVSIGGKTNISASGLDPYRL